MTYFTCAECGGAGTYAAPHASWCRSDGVVRRWPNLPLAYLSLIPRWLGVVILTTIVAFVSCGSAPSAETSSSRFDLRQFGMPVVEGVETVHAQSANREDVSAVGVGLEPFPLRPAPTIPEIIRSAASIHGANPDQLLRVARCESSLNPSAIGDHGAAVGLFQFHPATFMANVRYGGFPYDLGDRFDPAASANVAAWMFARGQSSQWSCR